MYVTAVAVGQSQPLYSGVGIFNCAFVVGHRKKRGAVLQRKKKMALLSSFDLP
jgi:hypothetical protein